MFINKISEVVIIQKYRFAEIVNMGDFKSAELVDPFELLTKVIKYEL